MSRRPRIIFNTPDGSKAVYCTVRPGADPEAELAKAREFLSRSWRGRPDADELAASVRLETLADLIGCRRCGSSVLVADYFVPESQGVLILDYDGDEFEFEYDGSTRSYDAEPDDGYRCRECGETAETLEELCGLPRPKAAWPLYKCEVFDSLGTLAISFASNGQDVAHLRWTDSATAADEHAEPSWHELTDAERQAITDAVVAAVEKITRGPEGAQS